MEIDAPPSAPPKKFDLFISYSTDPDYSLARKLEGFLESFHQLSGPSHIVLRPLQVCVDGSDFIANRKGAEAAESNAVTSLMEAYLRESSQLLVLCSANAVRSTWVDAEVAWFLKYRSPEDILLAVTEGDDPSVNPAEVFSDRIRQSGLMAKPWYDFRGFRRATARRAAKLRDFDENRIALAAHLLGYSVGEIQPVWFREQQRLAKRRSRISYGVGFVFLILALLACWSGYRAFRARQATEHELYYSNVLLADRALVDGDFALTRRSLGIAPERLRGWEWRYLDRSARKLVGRIGREGSKILKEESSPDGTRLAVAFDDQSHSVVLWDLRRASIERELVLSNSISSMAWSSPAKSLVLGSSDGFIHLVEPTSTGRVSTIRVPEAVVSAAFIAPVSQRLICVSHTNAFTDPNVLNFGSTNLLQQALKKPLEQMIADRFAEAVKRKLSIAVEGPKLTDVTIWDLKSGAVQHQEPVAGLVHLAAIHPSQDILAISDSTGVIRVVDLNSFAVRACTRKTPTKELPDQLSASEEASWDPLDWLRFSPRGRFIVAAQHDGRLQLWDPATARLVAEIKLQAPVSEVTFDGREEQLSVTDATGIARLFNAELDAETAAFGNSGVPMRASAIETDGSYMATCALDGQITVWDTKTRREIARVKSRFNTRHIGWVSPDRLLTVADNELELWSLERPRLVLLHPPTNPRTRSAYDTADSGGAYGLHIRSAAAEESNELLSAEVSQNGQRVLARFNNGLISTWDATTGRPLAALATGPIGVSLGSEQPGMSDSSTPDAWISRDGRTVLTFCPYRGFGIWNCDDGKLRSIVARPTSVFGPGAELYGAFFLRAASAALPAPQIDPSVKRLAYTFREYKTKDTLPELHLALVDIKSDKELVRDEVAENPGITPHFDPTGTLLVYQNRTGSLVCRNAADGQERFTCTNSGSGTASAGVSFSRDGSLLAVALRNGTIQLVETATGRTKASWSHTGLVPSCLVFDDNTRKLFGFAPTGTDHQTNSAISSQVTIWDLRLGRVGQMLSAFTQAEVSPSGWVVTPDGSRMFSADSSGVVACWETATARRLLSIPAHQGNIESIHFNSAESSLITSCIADQSVRILTAGPGLEYPAGNGPVGDDPKRTPAIQVQESRYWLQQAQALAQQAADTNTAWCQVLRTRTLCGSVVAAKVEALHEPDQSRRSRGLHAITLALIEKRDFEAAGLCVDQIESEVYHRLAEVALVGGEVSAGKIEAAEQLVATIVEPNEQAQCLEVLGVALARQGKLELALTVASRLAAGVPAAPIDSKEDEGAASDQAKGDAKPRASAKRKIQSPVLVASSWQSPPWRSFLANVVRELSAARIRFEQDNPLDYPFALDAFTRRSVALRATRAAAENGDAGSTKQYFEAAVAGAPGHEDGLSEADHTLEMADFGARYGACEGALEALRRCEYRLSTTNVNNRPYLGNPAFNAVCALQLWLNAAATAWCDPHESSRRFELGERRWAECLSRFGEDKDVSTADGWALQHLGSEYLRNCLRETVTALKNKNGTAAAEDWVSSLTSPSLKGLALEQLGELAWEQRNEDLAREYSEKAIALAPQGDDQRTEPPVCADLFRKLAQAAAQKVSEDENWFAWIQDLPASRRIYACLGAAEGLTVASTRKPPDISDPPPRRAGDAGP